jgi:hypothetical protein
MVNLKRMDKKIWEKEFEFFPDWIKNFKMALDM